MATDVQADIAKMIDYTGYLNSFFYTEWIKFADPMAWDGQSCSEIACCISFMAGNLSKIFVSNYAQGIYDQYLAAGRTGTTPQDGAFVIFGYGGVPDHTGRVMSFDANNIYTFEGNVGGRTVQRTWDRNDPYIFSYCYPYYDNEELNLFDQRTDTPADENLAEYNTTQTGGINTNTQGTGAVYGADVLQSPYGYGQGRMLEIHNDIWDGNTAVSSSVTPPASAWSQGGISNSGGNSGSSTRIRTGYRNFNSSIIYINMPAGFRGQVFEYSAQSVGSFIQKLPIVYTFFNAGIIRLPVRKGYYYRLVIVRSNNGSITPADLPAGYTITGYQDYFPIVSASDNIFEHFNTSYRNWINAANDYNFDVGTEPKPGAVGVWYSASLDMYHMAVLEDYINFKWYISESWSATPTPAGSWDYSELGADPDYLPVNLPAAADWSLLGFIYPFYPIPAPDPPGPIPGGENYKPYWRHQRRGRG